MKHNTIFILLSMIIIFSMVVGLTAVAAQTLQSEVATSVPGWKQVNISGFGNPKSWAINRMTIFGDYLYAGTRTNDTGGEVWRTENGTNWNQVNISGFGVISNTGALPGDVFNSYLYVGTLNNTLGAEIWRTPNGTSWEQVVSGGFGNTTNYIVERIVIFDDMLYATTNNNTTGVEVWRSSTGNAGSWNQCNIDGFGDDRNNGLWAVTVFNNHLYAATAQWKEAYTGIEVWRTNDGTNWARVNADGFGNPELRNSGWIETFMGNLYLLSDTPETGAQILRCALCDGTDWSQVISDGFGSSTNHGGSFMIEYENYFYAATKNEITGVGIWRTANGTQWNEIMVGGFGDPNNVDIWSGNIFANNLFLGTVKNAGWGIPVNGGQVWMMIRQIFLPIIKR